MDRPHTEADARTPPPATLSVLRDAAHRFGTPCYVYFVDRMRERLRALHAALGGRFGISYAVKANPNAELLRRITGDVAGLDCSSIGEVDRALASGYPASRLTFSGPAKRIDELRRAVEVGLGALVCESPAEIEELDRLAAAARRRLPYLVRINPAVAPKHFGVNMSGKPSQFGLDEEDLAVVLQARSRWKQLDLAGFHVYSGSNCLHAEAIVESFRICAELFSRFARIAELRPRKLIFGAGFGIPYHLDQRPLDLDTAAARINLLIDTMRQDERLADAQCLLELGRWVVGPEGYFLTTVVREKRSRGTEIRLCDAGFNDHLAACGMMGTVIRRNWPIWKIAARGNEPVRTYLLTGPLCTTIDQIATRIELPELSTGDVLAIGSSGAYGLTASPTRFISHPEPREVMVLERVGAVELHDITERVAGGRPSRPAAHEGR